MGALPMLFSMEMSGVMHRMDNSTKQSISLSCNGNAQINSFMGGPSAKTYRFCSSSIRKKYKFVTSALSQRSEGEAEAKADMLVDVISEETSAFSYLFRSEFGGVVKVLVGSTATKYVLHFEVSSEPKFGSDLVLDWAMYRSDPTNLTTLDSIGSVVDETNLGRKGNFGIFSKPFDKKSTGEQIMKLEFDSSQPPFYLSFTLNTSHGAVGNGVEIRTHRKTKFCVPVGVARGNPSPLGVSYYNDGTTNFALFSRHAESVILCLYSDMASDPCLEIALDPYLNRTGDTWHILFPNVDNYVCYGYRCGGPKGNKFDVKNVLLDPYARLVDVVGGNSTSLPKSIGLLKQEPSFDWSGDTCPQIPLEQLVVYRLNVGKFTEDATSMLPEHLAGSFAGIVEKINHLKHLGVNAILLEPIFLFSETKGPHFPYHFFSPMNIYGPQKDVTSAMTSMKNMVKVLHANGIEVLLEVVLTHSAEGGDADCQMVSFGGIDNSSYYEGSGAFRCTSPVVQKLILDSLRHWVVDFHIDGFCLLNASSLVRDSNGLLLPRPPLIEAIAFDPLLSNTKLIADCWSPLDMSYKEVQFPHWKRWAEMNSRFRNDVRNFLRGKGLLSRLATRLCGSGDVFSRSRGPAFSFNFIAKNSGLPLVDLVSFSDKTASELSWNCGDEGPTTSADILDLRLKQIRNFVFILFISLGVPVLNMGDEYGLSTGGSTSYNKRGPFNWNSLKSEFAVQTMDFIAFLTSLRARRNDLFQVRNFHKAENIEWHGSDHSPPNWDDVSCKFLAMSLKAEKDGTLTPASNKGDVFVAINAGDKTQPITLPQLPEGSLWLRLVDTALPYPIFFKKNGELDDYRTTGSATYEMQSHSCTLFESMVSGN